ICVIAGETARVEVTVSDPDIDQKVRLSAIGGPLLMDDQPATFTVLDGYQDSPLTGIFEWIPSCDHILGQPYTMVFKGTDNDKDTTGLSTLKTLKIKVVGPPPEDVIIEQASLDSITVTWHKPYFCEMTMEDYFRGFSVYRRIGSNQFPLDTCSPGLEGRGYERVAFSTLEMRGDRYVFLDQDIQKGQTYCYRIVAEFARLTLAGNAFNFVESLPSEERCVQIGRDLPLITNASVLNTDMANGEMEIIWTKPEPIELDTIANPGPYRYQLLSAEGITSSGFSEVTGASFVSNSFSGLVDTMFLDTGLNTAVTAYTYQVAFYTGSSASPFGFSDVASSIYLNVNPTDRANVLTWNGMVPWQNYEFEIYKRDNNTGVFNLLTSTVDMTYRDMNLINGEEYCYYIRSIGTYGIDNIADPLYNLSQEDCASPLDNVPPCAPEATVENNCATAEPGTPATDIINILNWNNPLNTCPGSDDNDFFTIYFSPSRTDNLSDFVEIDNVTDTFYNHTAISSGGGCYYISATDINGNESEPGPIICIDNCPAYSLPNAFTPNLDGSNDFFVPYPYRYIDRIEMKIYNQWGNLVFETENPDINWDGLDINGKELSSGAYYYICRVFEANLDGIEEQMEILSGFIQLIRNSK
ncbi:MAG: gliding motility-associated C-terminal domain-containing protein, partial [Bacteroidia bacterium]|nr:gliding motility-associated C-terminal domain-containing protein [Bacteroidia bacterium]